MARVGIWLAVALVILGAAGIRLRLLDVPLDRDEGEYAYFGQLLLEGIPPYAAAYNLKAPGIYGAYALILAGQGVRGTQSPQEPPPVEVTHPTMVVAVEAEKAADGDHVRFEYIVGYLSTSTTGTPIVQHESFRTYASPPFLCRPAVRARQSRSSDGSTDWFRDECSR